LHTIARQIEAAGLDTLRRGVYNRSCVKRRRPADLFVSAAVTPALQ
jgi:hypothetical protein